MIFEPGPPWAQMTRPFRALAFRLKPDTTAVVAAAGRVLVGEPVVAFVLALVPFVVWAQAPAGRQGAPAQPAQAQPLPPDAPFTVAVATSTLEAAPVYIAVARGGQANYRFINGGVRSLLN